jgi:rod shape determining protein RodA
MVLAADELKKAGRFDSFLLILIFLLTAIGLINLYSALGYWGDSGNFSPFWSQFIWVGIGVLLMFFLAFFDYRLIEKIAVPIYVLSILLLVGVLFFGKEVAGHKSWLGVGSIGIQPSEFAKLALVIILSKHFSGSPHPQAVALLEMWKPILYSVIPTILVVLQGDLGSAMFFVLIFGTYAWFGRLKGKWVAILILGALLGSIFLYFFGLSDYQRARFTVFMDPTADSRGTGYHLIQSRIAVGSGRWIGRGYLKGNINKLKYLPEKHTDFIFPVLAEEWGFVGCCVTLTLYLLLFISGIDVAKRSRDRTGLFLALGIVAFIFWHVVINLGGVLGLMPLTGVTLPFLSYGGSSTIITLSSMGILLSISMKRFLF